MEGLLQGHFAAQTLTGIGAFTARNGTTFEGQVSGCGRVHRHAQA